MIKNKKKIIYLLFIFIFINYFHQILSLDSAINSIVLDSSDNIFAGGYFFNGQNLDFAIAKYIGSTGVLDTSYNQNGNQPGIVITDIANNNSVINSIKLDHNSKIVAGGYTTISAGDIDLALSRYNADGTLDTTFNANGPIPGIIITNVTGNNDFITSIAINTDNSIIAAGYTLNNAQTRIILAKYTSDGVLDTIFNTGGSIPGLLLSNFSTQDRANAVIIDSNNKILICGSTSDLINQEILVARYNQDGTLDTTFNSGGIIPGIFRTQLEDTNNTGIDIKIDQNNKIVVACDAVNGNKLSSYIILRLNENGTLDTTFNPIGDIPGMIFSNFNQNSVSTNSLAIDNNNQIVVSGFFTDLVNPTNTFTARYNNDGTFDTTFNPSITPGYVITPVLNQLTSPPTAVIFSQANSNAINSNNEIFTGGYSIDVENNFTTIKYNSDGTLNINYNPNTIQSGVLITPIFNGITNTQDIFFGGAPDYNYNFLDAANPNPFYLAAISQKTVGYTRPIIESPSNNFETNEIEPLLEGIAQPNSLISVFVDNINVASTVTDITGYWQTIVPALVDGEHNIFIRATDPISNLIFNSNNISIKISTAKPKSPKIFTPKNNIFLNKKKVLITGDAPGSIAVGIYINGTLKQTVETKSNGNWSYLTDTLPDGKYEVTVIASDSLGNISKESTSTIFYIDTKSPTKPIIRYPKNNSIINQNNIIIEAETKPYQEVEININNKIVATIKSDEFGKIKYNLNKLKDNKYNISLKTKDKITNKELVSEQVNFEINTKDKLTNQIRSIKIKNPETNNTTNLFIDKQGKINII